MNKHNDFVVLCQHFPIKAHNLAESIGVNIGELRRLIYRGDYYINDNCELCENGLTKALNQFGDAVNGFIKENKR